MTPTPCSRCGEPGRWRDERGRHWCVSHLPAGERLRCVAPDEGWQGTTIVTVPLMPEILHPVGLELDMAWCDPTYANPIHVIGGNWSPENARRLAGWLLKAAEWAEIRRPREEVAR